jgi:hypothetical protein
MPLVGLEHVLLFARISSMDVTSGDADVNTTSGGRTEYSVEIDPPKLENNSTLKIRVKYKVMEKQPDHTVLERDQVFQYPLPAHIKKAIDDGRTTLQDFDRWTLKGEMEGKFHGTIRTLPNSPFISTVDNAIDGSGKDHDGNAHLHVIFRIPFLVATA